MTYPVHIQALLEAFLGTPDANQAQRQTITDYAVLSTKAEDSSSPIPTTLKGYLDKVIHHAYQVTDQDMEQLRSAGYSEDDIYEITLSAALGAGLGRWEIAMTALKTRKGESSCESA